MTAQSDVRKKLRLVQRTLQDVASPFDEHLMWAAECIGAFIDERAPSLDHAFGLRTSKRGAKPGRLDEGKHADWAPDAWMDVIRVTPPGRDWPSTKQLADIAKQYPLRKCIEKTDEAEDHALAADLKRILDRYKPQIKAHWSRVLLERLNGKDQAE